MTELTVRAIREDELRTFMSTVSTAFGETLDEQEFESNQKIFEPKRTFVATEADRVVGGGASFSFQLTVPGGAQVGAAGVTAVGTLPTHRRRGALRLVMRRLLEDAREHGDPLAILWASEGSIYQRFGYGMGTSQAEFDILQAHSAYREDVPTVGTNRLVDAEEAARLLPPLFAAVGGRTPGFFQRSQTWWDTQLIPDPERWRRGAGPKFFVVHETDGTPDGYAVYRIKSEWEGGGHKSTLIVRELMGTTPAAIRELWRYVFSVDLVLTVRGVNQPPDHPLLLMLMEPRRLRLTISDQLWLRIVDVAAALEARTYAASDRLTFNLSDAFLPDQAGRWSLDTTGDKPKVERVGEASGGAADLTLDVTDLACLYLGAFSATNLADAGRTIEHTPGSRAKLDAMFATARRPWCPTGF